MRIGIYARGLSGIGGVKQYIESMTREMIALVGEEDALYILHNLEAPYFSSDRGNVTELLLPSRNRIYCDHLLAPAKIRELALDAVWFPKYVVPFGVDARAFVTVHDMAYFLPEFGAYPLADTLYMKTLIRRSCRRADRVIAVSENTRADITRLLGVGAEKIAVIHEAADPKYRPIDDRGRIEAFRARMGLPERYILFAGGISPRKNLIRLAAAFRQIGTAVDHRLVITGAKGWKNREALAALGSSDRILRLGFVEDEDMPLLYNGASLFVYPSLYEGFGLPILEAQSCGCPVVAGRNSSLVEVGGDAVLFCDPTSVEGIRDAMLRALTDGETRQRLIRSGFENARRFSWTRAAEALLELMRG